MVAVFVLILTLVYWLWTWERMEVFKLLLSSFFPLALLILAVLGSIVFGLATPAEAAAVGAFGAFILTAVYRFIGNWKAAPAAGRRAGVVVARTTRDFLSIIKESSFLTARTSAMVCWLFVGSAIFSAHRDSTLPVSVSSVPLCGAVGSRPPSAWCRAPRSGPGRSGRRAARRSSRRL